MNAASLMVRIGADVEDFSRGMSRVQKEAKRGFKEIGEAGTLMSEVLTIELGAAALEFGKLAAEASDASARMDRVFGGAAEEMKHHLEELTHTVPETIAALEGFAVKSDNLLLGLGETPEKAAAMSESMVKLAGDMAAFAHVPVGEALDALDRGLAGKTRGLVQFGIVVQQAQIHQEAMRRGLIDNHRALTEAGTAEIAYSLITQASARITGEAARTAGQASQSFAFMKREAEEMGVAIGNIVLPPLVAVVHTMTSFFTAVERAPKGLLTFAVGAAALAAAVGPALLLVARIGKEIVALQRASALLAAGEGVAAVIGAIAAAPIATVVTGIAAITAAVGGLYYIWQKFQKQDDKSPLLNDPSLFALAAPKGPPVKPPALSRDPRSALDIFKEHATLVEDAYKFAIDMGSPLESSMTRINALHAQAITLLNGQKGALTEMAKAAGEAIRKTQLIMDTVAVARAMGGNRPTSAVIAGASRNAVSQTEIGLNAAQAAISQESALRAREAGLRMTDTFQVAREAAASLGERFRTVAHDFGTGLAQFKTQWGSGRNIADSAGTGLKEAATSLLAGFTPAGLAAAAFGKVMQGLQPVLDALMEPLVELGQILGVMIKPILHPLFEALKAVGIAAAFLGEVFYTEAAVFARVVGNIWAGIGKLISHIPFLGSIGEGIENAGNGLLNLATSFQNTANDLDHSRRTLQDLQFLGTAATTAANALLNVPQGFRVALAQYQAQQPSIDGSQWYPNAGASSQQSTTIILKLDSKEVARGVLKSFKASAQTTYADAARWPDLMSV